MGQGIDCYASLRAACEKYGVEEITLRALLAHLEERYALLLASKRGWKEAWFKEVGRHEAEAQRLSILEDHILTDRAHMHCPMRSVILTGKSPTV